MDPFTGDKLPAEDAQYLYRGLWITYLSKNPDLVAYAQSFDEFSNTFSGPYIENKAEVIIEAYAKGDRERYIASVKASHWYQNMANRKKHSLEHQIQAAEEKSAEQMSFLAENTGHHTQRETSR